MSDWVLLVPVPHSWGLRVNAALFRPRQIDGREVLICQTCDRVFPAPTVEAHLTNGTHCHARVLELEVLGLEPALEHREEHLWAR